MSFIPIKDAWDILKDVATGAKKIRQGRRERQERARAERDRQVRQQVVTEEQTYEKELQAWQQLLDSAEPDEEKSRIRQEMFRVREERARYYRATRELSLPEEMKDRMGPVGIKAATAAENSTTESGQ